MWPHPSPKEGLTALTYMTEVGLGRMQALGPKWVAGYGPCRKCPRLEQTDNSLKSLHIFIFRVELIYIKWRFIYLHLSHLFGQLSAVSSTDAEASDSCCSGNRCKLPPDRCSGQSGLRRDLFTSFRLLGSFPCRSCCLCECLDEPPSSAFLEGSPSSMPSILMGGKNNSTLLQESNKF